MSDQLGRSRLSSKHQAEMRQSQRSSLRALIDRATGDSVDESEEYAGLLSMIRDEVICPFSARVAGEDVECIRFEWPKTGFGLHAVCKSTAKTFSVDIGELEWIEPRPKGHEWIDAYFAWRDLLGGGPNDADPSPQTRVRDDSQVRILRMATQAREEVGLVADAIDWAMLYQAAGTELARGRTEAQIDWRRLVERCKKGPSQ